MGLTGKIVIVVIVSQQAVAGSSFFLLVDFLTVIKMSHAGVSSACTGYDLILKKVNHSN